MEDDATLAEYLDRLELHNELFNDDIRFEGIVESEHGPAVIISQRFVAGASPDTEAEIESILKETGWFPTGDGHWQKRHEGQIIGLTDIKLDNWIRVPGKSLVPIDVIPFVATEAMTRKWLPLPPEKE